MPLTRNVSINTRRNNTSDTVSTYNSRYPGLDESNYRKLEMKIDNLGLTGYEKQKAMDEAYPQILPLVQAQTKNSERRNYINQSNYELSQMPDGEEKTTGKMKIGAVSLAQDIKEKYNIDPSIDDNYVLRTWTEKIPNGNQLLASYLNTGDKTLLYKGGLVDAPETKLDNNFWSNVWNKMKVASRAPLDAWDKFAYRTGKNLRNFDTKVMDFFADTIPMKSYVEDKLGKQITDDEYNEIIGLVKDKTQEKRDINEAEVLDYNRLVNYATQKATKETGSQDVMDYYNNKGYTELLWEGDFDGFFYKGLGDAAQNRDMPLIIAASVVNPGMGYALMGADSYARENQEAFENMIDNGATYEQAETVGQVVGLINAAVEVLLDKRMGGVETTASNAIKKTFMKNVQEVSKKGLGSIFLEGAGRQARSSFEEGLEERVQQVVHNAAVMTVKENPELEDLFKGGWTAFEGGFYNPMNLLAGGSNVINDVNQNQSTINQQLQNGAYNLGKGTRAVTDTVSSVGNAITNPNQTLENAAYNLGKGARSFTDFLGVTEGRSALDRISDWGAEKITNTATAQDKLFKAQEPRMEILTRAKDLGKKKTHADRANQLIIENGYIPTDTESRINAHENTMQKIWKKIEDRINGGKEIMIDMSLVADKIDEYVQKQENLGSTLNEKDIARLKNEANKLRGETLDLLNLERLKQLYNAVIKNWGEEKVSDTMQNGLREATATIGLIEDGLLARIPGEFQGLKNDFGALKDMHEDVFKANLKNQRRKGKSLTETYSRIEGIGDIANGILGMLSGKGDLGTVAKGAAKLVVGKSLAKARDVDFLVNQGFKELAEEYNKGGKQKTSNSIVGDKGYAKKVQEMKDRLNLDRNIGENSTDTVISEDVNETAGNQAQELYNQGDENLSPNSEQMETIKPNQHKYDRLQKNLEKANSEFRKLMAEYNRTGIKDYKKMAEKQQKEIIRLNKEIDAITWEWNEQQRREEYNNWNDRVMMENNAAIALNEDKTTKKTTKKKSTKKGKKGDVKWYADEAYKPSITMKTDDYINEDVIKQIRGLVTGEKFGVIDTSLRNPRKGVIQKVRDGYEIRFEDGEEGYSSFPKDLIKGYKIEDYTKPDFGEPKFEENVTTEVKKETKKPTKKSQKEDVNNLISDTWHDIGDEGDWDWYKKMKKKDVITYLEDQVLDEFSDARKRGYDYGLEWSEVQKLIKKFVNEKLGNNSKTKQYADESYKPEIVMTEDEINKFEERKEVNIRDVIREAGAPKKGVSIEKQLKALDNVESVEGIKKDLIFEQYSEKDLKNELKLVKKYYKEAVKNWKEEGGYYYRDRAAYFLNKIDAIEEMLKG